MVAACHNIGRAGRPIVTRQFPDDGGDQPEEIEVLMQGLSGPVLHMNLDTPSLKLTFSILVRLLWGDHGAALICCENRT